MENTEQCERYVKHLAVKQMYTECRHILEMMCVEFIQSHSPLSQMIQKLV